jgi:rhamnosyltransferase subunit B
MNVLLIPLGSSGDVNPFVAIGQALVARGHRVTMITAAHYEPLARRSGFEFEPLGSAEDYHAVLEDPGLWDPVKGFRIVMEWAVLKPLRMIYELVESRNIPGETVVVAPVLAFGARIAQEKLGIPLVTVTLQPAMFRSLVDVSKLGTLPVSSRMPKAWNRLLYWFMDVGIVDRLIAPETNAFRKELGLPPARRLF